MNKTIGLTAGRPSENRKKAMAAITNDCRIVRVNFDLNEEEHMRLKMHAVKSRRSISEILRELIDKNIPKVE
jgi:hypothetical protein